MLEMNTSMIMCLTPCNILLAVKLSNNILSENLQPVFLRLLLINETAFVSNSTQFYWMFVIWAVSNLRVTICHTSELEMTFPKA